MVRMLSPKRRASCPIRNKTSPSPTGAIYPTAYTLQVGGVSRYCLQLSVNKVRDLCRGCPSGDLRNSIKKAPYSRARGLVQSCGTWELVSLHGDNSSPQSVAHE